MLDGRNHLARSRRLAEIELHDAPLLGQLDLLDLLQRLDSALDLRGLGRMSSKALDKPLLLGEHGLLSRISGLAVGLADRAFAFVEVVVAGVRRDFATVDLG